MITIIQEPQEFTPAYNPIDYVVTSDNILEPSFQFVFDLYVGGAFISRHRLPIRVGSDFAKIDVSSIVKSYVTHDFSFESTAFDKNYNSYQKIQVKFGEEYSVGGVLTTFVDLLSSSFTYAINASLEYLDFVGWNTNEFTTGTTRKFLTNNNNIEVTSNNSLALSFIIPEPENIFQITITTYDAEGATINTDQFVPVALSNTNDYDKFLRINVGANNLKQLFGNDFFDGASYYTVWVVILGMAPFFEVKRINIIEESCTHTNIPIHFLNTLGGFDLFNFKMASTKESDIERKEYKTNVGSFSDTDTFVYSAQDRTYHTLSISSQDTITANTDWISEADNKFLKELVTSPVVYAEIDGVLVPITLQSNKFIFNKTVNKKLFNLTISFKVGGKNYRQSY